MRYLKISVVKFLFLGIAMLMLGNNLLAQATLTLPSVTGQKGTVKILPITVDFTGKHVSSFQFRLYYDPSKIEIDTAFAAGLTVGNNPTVNYVPSANGELRVAWASATELNSAGTLLNLRIKLLAPTGPGGAQISFVNPSTSLNTLFVFDNVGPIAVTVTPGSGVITIPSKQIIVSNVADKRIGDEFLIPVKTSELITADGIVTYSFNGTFNKDVINITGIETAGTKSASGSIQSNISNAAGTVAVAFANSTVVTAAEGDVLVYLKATAVGNGANTLHLVSFKFNDGAIVPVTFDGTVSVVGIPTFSISGKVTYDNSLATPLKDVTMSLKKADNSVVTTMTDADGAYSFTGLVAGTYQVTAAKSGPVNSGINAADALLASRNYNDPVNVKLDTVQTLAADVDNSGVVANGDALAIVKRYVGLIQHFTKSDWTFFGTKYNVEVTTANVVADFQGLVTGDVNKSFVPGTLLKSSALDLRTAGTMNVEKKSAFSVPVSVAEAMELGAISMKIAYPANLVKFDGITVADQKILVNEKDGVITLAYADLTNGKNPVAFKAGQILAKVNFTVLDNAKDGEKVSLSLSEGEFVSVKGDVFKAAVSAPEVTVAQPKEFSVSPNYPNPFNPTTTIAYTLPTSGNVKIDVYNINGQLVSTLVNGMQETGAYKAVWNATNMSSGVYFYRVTFNGVNNSFTQTKSMVLMK